MTLQRSCQRSSVCFVVVVVLAGAVLACPTRGVAEELPPPAKIEIDYKKHIEPILKKTCFRCHGAKRQKSDYRMDSRESLLKGGEIGEAIIPGKSAESPLIRYVAGLDEEIEMPPSGDPLTKEQVGLLRAWIDQGVKFVAPVSTKVAKPKEEKGSVEAHPGLVTSLAIAPGNAVLVSAGGQSLPYRPGEIKFWDLDGEEKATLKGHDSIVWDVAFSKDGKTLASASYGKKVKLWDVESGKEKATLEGHKNWVTSVAFSPDGKVLATGSEDATVKLWDLATMKEIATLEGHKGTVRALEFSSDGSVLASGSLDGTVKLWSASEKKEKACLTGHKEGVFALAFSPDGKVLASGSADTMIFLWKVADGAKCGELKGHKNWVTALAFSPDGKTLASGGYDKLVNTWNPAAGHHNKTLRSHAGAVWSVAYTDDGRWLFSGSQDGTWKKWDAIGAARRAMRF